MKEILDRYVPADAAAYCLQLWQYWQFDFVVTKERASKLGDFRWAMGKREKITVNGNLNPYNFLVTYLHEVAHLVVHRSYKCKQPAHGKAWKTHFQELLKPVMKPHVFPETVLVPLLDYAQNPRASSSAHLPLMLAFRAIDQPNVNSNLLTLNEIPQGELFRFNKKVYQRGEVRRVRILCTEQKTKKGFLFVAHAWVEKV
jgi:SprT protein